MSTRPAIIHRDAHVRGGVPVFAGTRVPFRNLIDWLVRGRTIDEFVAAFPAVSRQQAVAALVAAHEAIVAGA